jgi:hypothetical protein
MIVEVDAKCPSGVTKGDVLHGSATITEILKGQLMKKYAKSLVAVTFLLGLGVAAKAETRPEIIAKFPFQFVVGGKTLPAGTYKVSRLGDDPLSVLMLTNDNRTASVLVLPLSIAEPSSDKPEVGFERVGAEYLLSSIQTGDLVYNISVSRSLAMVAAAKPHGNVSGSGSAGGH